MRNAKAGGGLLVCGDCGSTLMYPVSCTPHSHSCWYVELRCPDCGSVRASVFDAGMLDALDRELDRSEAALEAELSRLTHANMVDYVSRFVSALNADAIQPADFAE